jgi:putative Holliday junction resolvase
MKRGEADLLLAFDFGLRRIGVATANRRTGTATPLTTLEAGREPPWEQIDSIIEQWQPGQLVVGLPDPVAAETIAAAATAFAAELEERYGLPVASTDESLTSRAAQSDLNMARRNRLMPRRIRKGTLDSHAACLIAEQWLREQ